MKRRLFTALALALVGASGAAATTIVYDNTTTDTFGAVIYSTGPYEQIGDLVTLGGVDRSLTNASVQFFNAGQLGGSFGAILRFWNPGAPVGAQIGDDYQMDGLAIDSFSVLNVSFSIPNLSVPDSLIATVQVVNASDGVDLGLDLFDPPAIGSSDNTSLIVKDTSFQTSSTQTGSGNLYLSLDATTLGTETPEPSTAAMMGGMVILAAFVRHSRRRLPLPPLS